MEVATEHSATQIALFASGSGYSYQVPRIACTLADSAIW